MAHYKGICTHEKKQKKIKITTLISLVFVSPAGACRSPPAFVFARLCDAPLAMLFSAVVDGLVDVVVPKQRCFFQSPTKAQKIGVILSLGI